MDSNAIDVFLADALRSPQIAWPADWGGPDVVERAFERILYHGVAGLLVDVGAVGKTWPELLRDNVRQQAIAQAMWENVHRVVLAQLLTKLARSGLDAVLLKGTAVAYGLYSNPSARQRGDSDLWIPPDQLGEVRDVFRDLGYSRHDDGNRLVDNLQLQEAWTIETAGQTQTIDLHWSALNAHALRDVLVFSDVHATAAPLPRLSDCALAADFPTLLLHTCLHRLMHDTSPYTVDGVDYYGGDRLIWLFDIHLLAGAMDTAQWDTFLSLARSTGASIACRDGLTSATERLGTPVPGHVLAQLGASTAAPRATRYLHSGQFRRAVMDVLSIDGIRGKLRYVAGRLFPGESFLRAKYPGMDRKPIGFLHVRRLAELVRKRPRQSEQR